MSKFSKEDIKTLINGAFEQAAKTLYKQAEKDPDDANVNAFASKKITAFRQSVKKSLMGVLNTDEMLAREDRNDVIASLKEQFVDAFEKFSSIEPKELNKLTPHIHLDSKSLLSGLEFSVTTNVNTNRSIRSTRGVSMLDVGSIQRFKSGGSGKEVEIKGTERTSSDTTQEGSWRKREDTRRESIGDGTPNLP